MARVTGGQKLRRQLRMLPDNMDAEVERVIAAGAGEILADIKANAPKDEGNLSNEALAKKSTDGLAWLIGYSAARAGFKRAWKRGGFEALFNEFGTVKMAAQPFIRPAYKKNLRRILDSIDAAVKRVLEKAAGMS